MNFFQPCSFKKGKRRVIKEENKKEENKQEDKIQGQSQSSKRENYNPNPNPNPDPNPGFSGYGDFDFGEISSGINSSSNGSYNNTNRINNSNSKSSNDDNNKSNLRVGGWRMSKPLPVELKVRSLILYLEKGAKSTSRPFMRFGQIKEETEG
jgi:hypothetical protein